MIISFSGLESIRAEYEIHKSAILSNIPLALGVVGSEMTVGLQRHVMEDWYYVYKPYVYKRRTDDPSLGTPLGDGANISSEVSGHSLTFTYTPTGEHQNGAWSDRHGDELIEWIQEGGTGIPPRPFWNNFLEEQRNGEIMNAFILGMGEKYPVIAEGGDRDLYFDPGESELSANEGQFHVDFETDTEDDLPF